MNAKSMRLLEDLVLSFDRQRRIANHEAGRCRNSVLGKKREVEARVNGLAANRLANAIIHIKEIEGME